MDERLEKWLRHWRNDYLSFVQTVIRPPQITPFQEKVLRAMSAPEAHVSAVTGTGNGKTTLAAWIAIAEVTCHLECRVPCTATVYDQVLTRLWPEISYWHKRMLPQVAALTEWHPESFHHVGAYAESSFAWPMAPNKTRLEAFQGVHAKRVMFVFDEAAGIPDEIWTAASGGGWGKGGRWLAIGNGNRASGAFWATHNGPEAKFWTRFTASSWDSPFAGAKYCETMRSRYGEDSNAYRIHVLGQFPKDDPDVLILHDWVQRAIDRQANEETRIPAVRGEKRILGVDPNNGGPDACGAIIRQGSVVSSPQRWRTTDHEQIAAKVHALWEARAFDVAHVEANGIGAAVVTVLKRLGIPVAAVDVSRAAFLRPRCAKLRDELWWLSREFFQGGSVGIELGQYGEKDALDDLKHELTTPKYEETDKIHVESKGSLRKADRLGHSPDLADALNITFAKGVAVINDTYRSLPKQQGFSACSA